MIDFLHFLPFYLPHLYGMVYLSDCQKFSLNGPTPPVRIEVVHNVEEKEPVVLPAEDLRRVIQLPQAVTAAGLPANPQ